MISLRAVQIPYQFIISDRGRVCQRNIWSVCFPSQCNTVLGIDVVKYARSKLVPVLLRGSLLFYAVSFHFSDSNAENIKKAVFKTEYRLFNELLYLRKKR